MIDDFILFWADAARFSMVFKGMESVTRSDSGTRDYELHQSRKCRGSGKRWGFVLAANLRSTASSLLFSSIDFTA